MTTSVFARGRGRGRGISSRQPLRRPGDSADGANSNGIDGKEVCDIAFLTKAINKLRFEPSDEGFERVTKLAKEFGTSDEKLKQIVDHLSQKSKEDSDFVATGIGIAKRICREDDIGPKFRGFLLKSAQEDYNSREEIKKKALSRWIGVVCFISEIFKVLRVKEAPLKPLASPIYSMISELLREEENEEEIDCFNLVFREIGGLLESVDKVCTVFQSKYLLLVKY